MYTFQIYGTLDDDLMFTDSYEIYFLAPLILFALIFLYGIRMRLFDRIYGIELDQLKRVTLKGKIKEENKRPYPYEATFSSRTFREEEEQYEDDGDNEPLFMG